MKESYAGYGRNELIIELQKMQELKEYYVSENIRTDIIINELRERVEQLLKENEELRKAAQKRDKAGRPPLGAETINEIEKMRNEGYTIRQISKKLGVSLGVVTKYNPDYVKRKY